MAEEINFDLDDLSIEEIELLEDKTGIPIDEIGGKGVKKGTMLRTVAFIMKRRENPEFTWEEAGKLKIGAAQSPLQDEPESASPEPDATVSDISSASRKRRGSPSVT